MSRSVSAATYFQRILNSASADDPANYKRLVRDFSGRTARVVMEETKEEFYVHGARTDVRVLKRKPAGVETHITISRQVIGDILNGTETPVEAFFLCHLRAQGTTAELYQMHRLFLTMAEIAVRSEAIRQLVDEFMDAYAANG